MNRIDALDSDVIKFRVLPGTAIVLVTGTVACWFWRRIKSNGLRRKAIQKKQTEQERISLLVNELDQVLDEKTVEAILILSGVDLLAKLKNGDLDPSVVLKAYLYKACKVTRELNCVTEVIQGCTQKVTELTQEDASKELPLFGLPVSVKECMQTKGTPSTAGLAMYLDLPFPTDDCPIVKVLRCCGAIPFVKTNLPQIMLSIESSNPIFGETSNPLNTDFAPGGSSSGEGALVGSGGSVFGIGSDIAGSIRVPSHFCGICGFKPTKHRLSSSGLSPSLPGQNAIAATIGPMARDMDTIIMAMRALLCEEMFKLDKNVPPIKFNENLFASKQPLRIGYYDDDGYMKPIPACQRAVNITKDSLENAGHVLVPYKIPDIELLMENVTRAFYMDGGRNNIERTKYDIVDKRLMPSWIRWKMPAFVRKIYSIILGLHSPRMGKDVLAYGGGDQSVYELWKLTAWIDTYKMKFWTEWKEKYKIDALICPVFPMVACPKGMVENMTAFMSYSIPFTTANCPAGTVPVTKVTQEDIDKLEMHVGHYDDQWDRHLKKACMGSINMSVGVQCVAPPWQEEVCLRLMKEVETLAKIS